MDMEAAAAHGDRGVASSVDLAAFYDRSFSEVYHYLSRAVLGNRPLAEDLTQETFASIVAAVTAGRAELHSMPWVMGVARHKLIDYYRKCESEKRNLAVAWSGGYGHDQQLDDFDAEDPARIADLLRELSAMHRLVLALKYLDDLSVDQIATSIDRSVRATESLLVRARRALASSLRESET
jgi:RNA polymerase sigma-70 factor, ECF subfamily